jgi:hypothetical protein
MSKVLICKLPENEVVEIPVPQEMPYLPQTDKPAVTEPEQASGCIRFQPVTRFRKSIFQASLHKP